MNYDDEFISSTISNLPEILGNLFLRKEVFPCEIKVHLDNLYRRTRQYYANSSGHTFNIVDSFSNLQISILLLNTAL